MTLEELKARLDEEGYGPLVYESGPRLLAINDLRVALAKNEWRVCETERGAIVHIHLATPDESVACRYWYDAVSEMMLFLKGFGETEAVDRLERAARLAGIEVHRNDVPPELAPDGRRYRIFVRGRDLRRARELASSLST